MALVSLKPGQLALGMRGESATVSAVLVLASSRSYTRNEAFEHELFEVDSESSKAI